MKNWSKKDYENAVGAIVKWFWEPLSDNCKKEIKLGCHRTITMADFICAVSCYKMTSTFKSIINHNSVNESDFENLDQILSFVEQYREQLIRFESSKSSKEHLNQILSIVGYSQLGNAEIIIDEDYDDTDTVVVNNIVKSTIIIDED